MPSQTLYNFKYRLIKTEPESHPDDPVVTSVPVLLRIPGFMEDPDLKYLLSNAKPLQNSGYWEIDTLKLNAAVQYFEKIQPLLKNNHEFSFYIRFSFQLVARPNQEPLEFQQSISLFVLYFAKTNSCFASIFFPFQEADEKFWKYIDSIKPYLPFVLEEKYLSLARIKNGRPSSFKKIVRPSL